MTKYMLTQHVKDRYLERVKNGLNTSNNLLFEILDEIKLAKDVTQNIFDTIPRYILYLYENYKSANMKILKKDNVYYICKKRQNTESLYDVLTCYYGEEKFKMFQSSVLSRQQIFEKISKKKKELKQNERN